MSRIKLLPADELDLQMKVHEISGFVREYRFMPKRRYRFDFANPAKKVAIEVEGGTWSNGRHVRGLGYENDCIKYDEAAILGWKVIRATTNMVRDGRAIDYILRSI